MSAMFVTIICDNCHRPFPNVQDLYWTPGFIMHQGKHTCPSCRQLHGEDIQKDKEGNIKC